MRRFPVGALSLAHPCFMVHRVHCSIVEAATARSMTEPLAPSRFLRCGRVVLITQ
jgi:hypothetical protein